MILALLCAFVSADAQTYRAGESSRPSFGASDTEPEGEEDSSVPGARSNIQTRTLSSYSSRQRDWSKGVQTQTVKTDTAGSKSFDDNASSQASQAVKAIQNRTDGTQQSSSSKSSKSSYLISAIILYLRKGILCLKGAGILQPRKSAGPKSAGC